MRLTMLGTVLATIAITTMSGCGAATNPTSDRSGPAQTPVPTRTERILPTVPATGGPGYSAALSARLVTTESLPQGITVDIATVMSADDGDRLPSVADSCSTDNIPLLTGTRLIGNPSAMAAATLAFDVGPDEVWVGSEIIRTYADDGARRAMAALRALIDRCPTLVASDRGLGSSRYFFAVAPGPMLGDETLHLRCRSTSHSITLGCDSLLVRIGTALVVVKEEANQPGGAKHLAPLTEAAVRRFQATGP